MLLTLEEQKRLHRGNINDPYIKLHEIRYVAQFDSKDELRIQLDMEHPPKRTHSTREHDRFIYKIENMLELYDDMYGRRENGKDT